jgi:hypothetical protein
LVGLFPGPRLVLDADSERSEVEHDIDPAEIVSNVTCQFLSVHRHRTDITWELNTHRVGKKAEETISLSVASGRIKHVRQDIGQTILVRLNVGEHIESGRVDSVVALDLFLGLCQLAPHTAKVTFEPLAELGQVLSYDGARRSEEPLYAI